MKIKEIASAITLLVAFVIQVILLLNYTGRYAIVASLILWTALVIVLFTITVEDDEKKNEDNKTKEGEKNE